MRALSRAGRAFALVLSWPILAGAQEPATDADDNKAECAQAYAQTQRLRQAGKLGEALQQAVFCAQSSCPELLLADCTRWVSEIEAGLPTIVLDARDPEGRPLADVRVSVDGKPLLDRLDGRALAIDPGEHLFRFERAGSVVERRAVVVEGSKAQHIAAQFAAMPASAVPSAEPPPTSAPAIPAAAWVAGGVALLGGAGFAVFGLSGNAKYDDLNSECSPRCSDDDLAAMRRDWLIADISGGVGLVSLGLAAFFVLSAPGDAPPASIELAPGAASVAYRSRF